MLYSIIQKSDVEQHKDLRLDAEYQKPTYLENEEILSSISEKFDKYIEEITGGETPLGASYSDSGTRFFRVQNIMRNYILDENVVFLSKEQDEKIKRSRLFVDDVLLTITGAYGKSATVTEKYAGSNINQHSVRIKIKNELNPFYVSTFLNCSYGKMQSDKNVVGTSRPALDYYSIRNFWIPIFSTELQKAVMNVVKLSNKKFDNFDHNYNQAKQILLSELFLTDWRPKHVSSFVKNYSETKKAERMDADYYQPKYDEILNIIKNCPAGWDYLGNLVTMRKCVEVGSEEYLDAGIPFVRVSNLSPFEVTKEKYISEKLYETVKQHQPEKGEILFSKDATPGIACLLMEQPYKMIPSSGILRLKNKSKGVNSEYLTLVLNSIIVKEQMNRDVGGSIILHWRPDQVSETVIPILSDERQAQIQQRIIKAFDLYRRAQNLLECAKRVVEIAIEQGEKAAMNWLSKEIDITK